MSGRIERLQERLEQPLLVSNPINLRYLTGFVGTNGIAMIGPDTRTFATDSRYTEQAAAQVDGGVAPGTASRVVEVRTT